MNSDSFDISLLNGGKAIDSGGYGCVFLPSLKCDNSVVSPGNISKLMSTNDANEEYNLIQKFNSKLKNIPNYSNYFLINDFKICTPSPLTNEDLINYNKECEMLEEQGITSTNINSRLNQVKTINMPYGGINVKKYIKNNFNSSEFVKLNNSLINLLQNGIVPMNKLNVYHGDLKSSNMLANIQTDKSVLVKIIDWGLSFICENIREIPKNVMRPIHFNLPLSIIVFNKSFDTELSNFTSKNPNWTQKNATIFTAMFLNNYIKTRNKSHINIVIKTIDEFNSLTNVLSKKFKKSPTNYILDYISEVVYKYTQNGKFNKLAYFNQVYLKNVDIWGFLTCYLDFYDTINSQKSLTSNDVTILGKIKKIFMETLFLNSTTPINIPNLVNKLMDLNSNFRKIESRPRPIGGKHFQTQEKYKKKYKKSIRIYKNKHRKNFKYNKTKKRNSKK